MESDWIPILDTIKKGKFEASVISTYNLSPLFYEEVVLRQLISAGCRHNVLLVDRFQFNECLVKPDSCPQTAGYNYTIAPIAANRAFHPKIALLVSRKKGLLFVGSHNMTYSGYGYNKELTTRIDISDGTQKSGLSLARHAWMFLSNWVDAQADKLPNEVITSFRAISRFAPWLMKQPESEEREVQFFGSEPNGESLWSRISKEIKGPIERVSVIGPFFDDRLEFLTQLQSDLKPREFIVGIEPTTVSIAKSGQEQPGVKFVDASGLAEKTGYLHAKAILIETANSGNAWLITGSANPSKPAWTASPESRNAEAVILHSGERALTVAENIGLTGLEQLPMITREAWDEITRRVCAERQQQDTKTKGGQSVIIGIAAPGGIKFSTNAFSHADFSRASCLDANHQIIEECSTCELHDDTVFLPITRGLNKIRFIEIHTKDSKCFCLVHHEAEISRRAVSSRQAQLRNTLASLQSDNPDLENLIITVEKIIFDEPFEVDPAARRKSTSKKSNKETETITVLGIDSDPETKSKRNRRMVTSGDIGHLFDVLIHYLGIDLEKEIIEVDGKGRTEEELIGSDDDENDTENENPPFVLDAPKLVKICNSKVKRLISRMIDHFEKTAQEKKEYDKCLVKLVAVLALLRELRQLDYKLEGIPFEESLFPVQERERLLKNAVMYLYGNKYKFLRQIDNDLDESPWDELSRLHGLLLWLAYDAGADLTTEKEFNAPPEDEHKRILQKSYLLLLTPLACSDSLAIEEAETSVIKTTPKFKSSEVKKWLVTHSSIGEKLFKLQQRAHKVHDKIRKKPRVGDFAFLRNEKDPTFHFVLESGHTVALSDVCEQEGKRLYPANQIASLRLPSQ